MNSSTFNVNLLICKTLNNLLSCRYIKQLNAMKKTISFLILTVFSFSYVQSQYVPPQNNYNINVTKKKSFSESFNEGLMAGAAARQAKAAQETARIAAMKDNYLDIKKDFIKDNGGNYKFVVLQDVSGYDINKTRIELRDFLSTSNIYGYVNVSGPKKYWSNDSQLDFVNRDPEKNIYMSYYSEKEGAYSLISKLLLKNNNGEIIFEGDYKNVPTMKILEPLLSKYETSFEEKEYLRKIKRDEAMKNLKEAKELLDLGVLTQDEYNELIKKYKDILLNKN